MSKPIKTLSIDCLAIARRRLFSAFRRVARLSILLLMTKPKRVIEEFFFSTRKESLPADMFLEKEKTFLKSLSFFNLFLESNITHNYNTKLPLFTRSGFKLKFVKIPSHVSTKKEPFQLLFFISKKLV